jgi:hypothetical protein
VDGGTYFVVTVVVVTVAVVTVVLVAVVVDEMVDDVVDFVVVVVVVVAVVVAVDVIVVVVVAVVAGLVVAVVVPVFDAVVAGVVLSDVVIVEVGPGHSVFDGSLAMFSSTAFNVCTLSSQSKAAFRYPDDEQLNPRSPAYPHAPITLLRVETAELQSFLDALNDSNADVKQLNSGCNRTPPQFVSTLFISATCFEQSSPGMT